MFAQQDRISKNIIFENKKIPTVLVNEIKVALSYFPELQNTRIDFILRDDIKNATMQAQPRVKTLFRKKSKRVYKIKIKRFIEFGEKLKSIQSVPSDVLVGWIAHELGHITDYIDRSGMAMVGFGLKYFTSRRFLMNAEIAADNYAIDHGFADEIIKTKKYITDSPEMPLKYRKRIDKLYMSPKEIRALADNKE